MDEVEQYKFITIKTVDKTGNKSSGIAYSFPTEIYNDPVFYSPNNNITLLYDTSTGVGTVIGNGRPSGKFLYKWNYNESDFHAQYALSENIDGITISADGQVSISGDADLPFGETTISIIGIYKGITYYTDFTITKTEYTSTPTRYELVPSVNVIIKYNTGIIDPSTISCSQEVKIGNNTPIPSDKTLVYTTSANMIESAYIGPVTIERNWTWIKFYLYDGTTLLDWETVPILSN